MHHPSAGGCLINGGTRTVRIYYKPYGTLGDDLGKRLLELGKSGEWSGKVAIEQVQVMQTGKRCMLKLKKELLRGRFMQQELQALQQVAPATWRLMLGSADASLAFSAPRCLQLAVRTQTEAFEAFEHAQRLLHVCHKPPALRSAGHGAPREPVYSGYQTGAYPRQFAEGGYVSKPTNATIGEAGESEYVIPASKMDSAIKRYAKGARGEAVTEGGGSKNSKGSKAKPVVNVNTGLVMRMDNKDYVTTGDLNSALGSNGDGWRLWQL